MYLERRVGFVQFLAVFLFSVAASTLASLYLAPPGFVAVGASGAMFGVFGCYLGGHVRPQVTRVSPWLLLALSIGTLTAALPPGQLPYVSYGYFGPDYGGNLVGLITGVGAALALAMIPRQSRRMVASLPTPGL
jgi:membrane associated rhomboid family serine protease